MNWIEKQPTCDKDKRELIIQFQTTNNDRMDQMQKLLDLLNQGTTKHVDASNSRVSPLVVTQCGSVRPVRNISLGFPHFDGMTPVLEWIFKVEKFFNCQRTPEIERVDIASIHFEKEVILWFQMLQLSVDSPMEGHFRPSPFDSPVVELFKLHQTGTISEYYLKFMALANKSDDLSDAAVLNCFLSGLNRDQKGCGGSMSY